MLAIPIEFQVYLPALVFASFPNALTKNPAKTVFRNRKCSANHRIASDLVKKNKANEIFLVEFWQDTGAGRILVPAGYWAIHCEARKTVSHPSLDIDFYWYE